MASFWCLRGWPLNAPQLDSRVAGLDQLRYSCIPEGFKIFIRGKANAKLTSQNGPNRSLAPVIPILPFTSHRRRSLGRPAQCRPWKGLKLVASHREPCHLSQFWSVERLSHLLLK